MEWLSWWNDADWIVRGVFLILGLLSVLSWSVILYKAFQFTGLYRAEHRTGGGNPSARVRQAIGTGGSRAALTARADAAARAARLNLESGLTLLATIGNASPFIGLFGTVWGIMHALQSLSGQEALTMDMVAGPVAEALVATAAGLFAAIPAVVGYNLLLRLLRRICGQIEVNALATIDALAEDA